MGEVSGKNSVDLFTRASVSEVAGRIKLVNGKIVAEGPEWVHELIKRPHGNWTKRNHKLISASAGHEFLVAIVEQCDGSGLRADWTPG